MRRGVGGLAPEALRARVAEAEEALKQRAVRPEDADGLGLADVEAALARLPGRGRGRAAPGPRGGRAPGQPRPRAGAGPTRAPRTAARARGCGRPGRAA